MRILLLFLIPFYFLADAQVKQINFLGKDWYLHGAEIRVLFPNVQTFNNPEITKSVIRNSLAAIEKQYGYTNRRPLLIDDIGRASDIGLSAGLVFKPFSKSDISILRSTEIAHHVGLRNEVFQYQWGDLGSYFDDSDLRYKSSMFFYQPSINISSGALLNRIKFYGGMDLRLATSNTVSYTALAGVKDSIFQGPTTNPRNNLTLNLARRDLAAGYTIGLKLAATCYFNIHVELKDLFMTSWYTATADHFYHRTTQLNLGFRYKFAGPMPEEEDAEVIRKTILW